MACIDHWRCGTRQVYNKQQHRRVLEAKLGRAPVRGEVAMHTCDNKRCINPEHLEVGTQVTNVRDAFDRNLQPKGSARRTAKLYEATVAAIRTEYVPRHPEHGTRAIARRLGVSQWTISHALRGETWRHV